MWRWNEHGELVEPNGTKHLIAASIRNEQTAGSIEQVAFSQSFTQSLTVNGTHAAHPGNGSTQDAQAEREIFPIRQGRLKVFQKLCENQHNTN
ncbi:hypothetical protein INT43_002363 [Umbelopsis isabellina]|uniref:Uncharacterized protein n=1 Tax=Mortierella isabellina TaxID=91625 RepID=A0A8H7Q5Y8_MORIS|nr:hypothetical protein INT43_002363 [Umbelopsis isabellina]